jgi:hypothetical protein
MVIFCNRGYIKTDFIIIIIIISHARQSSVESHRGIRALQLTFGVVWT